MLGQTFHLFIKALIIGLLVHVGLQQISTMPPLPAQPITSPHSIPLTHSSTNATEPQFSDQLDKTTP